MEKISYGLRVSLGLSRFNLFIFCIPYYKIVYDVLIKMYSKNCFYSFYFKIFEYPVFFILSVQKGVGLVIIKVNETWFNIIEIIMMIIGIKPTIKQSKL